MKLFNFESQQLTLNKDEVLLVREFANLWEVQRNKIPGDTRGGERRLAFREFTYIYLMYDWESPYKTFSEAERHTEAMYDASLSEKQMEDEKFRRACKKYQDMQETHMSRLLKSAYRTVDELRLFYELVNLQERDDMGKPIHNAKQILDSLGGLGKVITSIEQLEEVVRKQKEATSKALRGDVEPGMFD
jgi:hypothetical protein